MYLEARIPQVVRSIAISAPLSAVWRWLATQEGLRRWISSNLEIDLRVGGSYRFLGPDDSTWISGTVLELVPERSLILSWLEEDMGWLHPARFVVTLAPTTVGTRATVIHDGFEGIGADWHETVQDHKRGSDMHRIHERLADLVKTDEFPTLVASGISKHLMSLRAAGLVSATRLGRQQVYRFEPDTMAAALAPWIAKYERYWSAALERLRDLAQTGEDLK